MKLLMILCLSLLTATSYAQQMDKPFQLEPGNYSEECYSASVSKRGEEISRYTDSSKGKLKVEKINESYLETSTTVFGDSKATSATRTMTKDLGNGTFEQTGKYTTTTVSGKDIRTFSSEYVVTLKVTENSTQNISVIEDGKTRTNLVGENVWTKLVDGRILLQSYQREPTTIELKKEDGTTESYTSLSNSSTCFYKKIK